MSRCVDLDERVTAQFYDAECEEWTMQTCTIADVLDSVCDEYTVLPSAQPERMKGKWERHYCEDGNPDGWRCDNCDEWYYFGQTLPNFCPNCGADMRGE